MATVTLYTFEDDRGVEQTFSTFNPREAQEVARKNKWRCIANEYEWADSEVAWDFTGKPDPRGTDSEYQPSGDGSALDVGDELRAERRLARELEPGRSGRVQKRLAGLVRRARR